MAEQEFGTCRGDTRRSSRIAVASAARLAVRTASTAGAQTASVIVGDVSHEGMRIASRLPMPAALSKGASIRIRVVLAGRSLELPGEVVWVRPLLGGLWSAGIHLHRDATDDVTRESFDGCLAAEAA